MDNNINVADFWGYLHCKSAEEMGDLIALLDLLGFKRHSAELYDYGITKHVFVANNTYQQSCTGGGKGFEHWDYNAADFITKYFN